jgi:2-hydroxychromene-2-carboxylate isomerase
VARREGCFERYVDEVYRHMGSEPKKMDEPDVARAALEASGLPAESILSGVGDPAVKRALPEATEASVARGSFGCPTFFVGDEIFFGKDRLRDVEEEILARSGAAGGPGGEGA